MTFEIANFSSTEVGIEPLCRYYTTYIIKCFKIMYHQTDTNDLPVNERSKIVE